MIDPSSVRNVVTRTGGHIIDGFVHVPNTSAACELARDLYHDPSAYNCYESFIDDLRAVVYLRFEPYEVRVATTPLRFESLVLANYRYESENEQQGDDQQLQREMEAWSLANGHPFFLETVPPAFWPRLEENGYVQCEGTSTFVLLKSIPERWRPQIEC